MHVHQPISQCGGKMSKLAVTQLSYMPLLYQLCCGQCLHVGAGVGSYFSVIVEATDPSLGPNRWQTMGYIVRVW